MLRIVTTLLLSIYTILTFAQAGQTSRTDLEKQRQSIMESIRETQAQLEATKKDQKATLSQLRALQAKLNARQKLIGNINQEISSIDNNIKYSSQEVSQLSQNLELLKARYAQSIRYAYSNRNTYSMITFLFSANDFNDALRRMKYLKKYRDYRKSQVELIVVTKQKLQHKIGEMNTQKSAKSELLTTEEQQRKELLNETNVTNSVVKELKGREKELATTIEKNRIASRKLDKAINDLIRREIEIARKKAEEEERKRKADEAAKAALTARNNSGSNYGNVTLSSGSNKETNPATGSPKTSPSTTTNSNPPLAATTKPVPRVAAPSYALSLTPEVTALSNSFAANKGKLPWPVEKGFIARNFGKVKHPLYDVYETNNGVDIQANPNANVRAVYEGTVTSVLYMPGMGQSVILNHGQFFTVYSRLGKVSVKKGDNVQIKQTIGTVMEGDENASYMVHFELWRVGGNNDVNAQDPAGWIAR